MIIKNGADLQAAHVFLYDLPFPYREYGANFFHSRTGPMDSIKSGTITIENGITKFETPVFIDDMVVHIIR